MRSLLRSENDTGFTLPVILLISVGLMIVGLSLIQSTSSVQNSLDFQYRERAGQLAAEAGATYANYCLSKNNLLQTWGPENSRPNLTQRTDCNGIASSNAPNYLMQQGTFRTSFTIGDLATGADKSVVISSAGTFEQTRGSSSSIAYTLDITRKQLVISKELKASIAVSGTYKSCAIITNELYCWGQNDGAPETLWGNLGDGTTDDSLVPTKVVQEAGVLKGKIVTDVSSAQYHSCALADGKVYCWGMNTSGQLGSGSIGGYSSKPVAVGGVLSGQTVTAMSTTGDSSCAIAGGKIYCWGENRDGTVGNNSTTSVASPTLVSTVNLGSSYTATALSSSGSRSFTMCAIVDGKAWCWGNNLAGQIGNNSVSARVLVPTKAQESTGILAGKTVTSISQDGTYSVSNGNSGTHVCAVASGKLYCWGENNNGQLGNNSTTDSPVPIAVTGTALTGKTVNDVAAGANHTCALAEGKAYCWGANTYGQLGTGDNLQYRVPTAVKATVNTDALYNKTITAIGGGANRGCATAEYRVYCWGLNADGQIGDGTQTNRNVPTRSTFLDPKAPAFIF